MSDAAFLARLSAAIQVQHEATMHLQQLATELIDHTQRMRQWTDKLHAHVSAARQDVVVPETPVASFTYSDAPLVLPRVLQGGPARER